MSDVVDPTALTSWARHSCRDGVVLRAPGGETWLRIRPRVVSPVTPFALVHRRIAAAFPRGASVAHAPVARMITHEGELAVLASAHVATATRTTGISVGVVGDAPCLCIEVFGAEHRAYAASLIRSLGLGLGAIRRRWFEYAPPAGWLGVRRDHATLWLHPAYPRLPGRITVFDARPHTDLATEELHRAVFLRLPDGLASIQPLEVEDVTSDHGLVGRLRRVIGSLDGHPCVRMASVHMDDRFSYVANVDGPDEASLEQTFRTMLASFRPVTRAPGDVAVCAY